VFVFHIPALVFVPIYMNNVYCVKVPKGFSERKTRESPDMTARKHHEILTFECLNFNFNNVQRLFDILNVVWNNVH
jgi:hypothetical protein